MDAVFAQVIGSEHRSESWKRYWFVPVLFALAGFAVFPFDVSIASVFKSKIVPIALDQPLRESLEICEAFGHGFGAWLIVIAIGVLAPMKRSSLPWVIVGSLGSGLVANTMKLMIHRTRPRDFDLTVGTVWNTFEQSFSKGAGMHSFPSAHTSTAVGLAVMLTSLFPHGRWFFGMMAFLVALQRIVSNSHFPSDVCAGAAVGWLVGMACVGSMRYWCRSH